MSPSNQIYSGATPAQIAADLAPLLDFQSEGISQNELEAMVSECLLPHLMQYDAPGFQSMFNAVPPAEAQFGARVMLETNQGVTNWQVSPGGAMLEELCGRALCRLFGLGPNADATFMYSGTYANQQALYLALHRHAERQGFDLAKKGIAGFDAPERLAMLVSGGAHFSLHHAIRMLGLGERSFISLPMDTNHRVDLDALHKRMPGIKKDRDIVCIVATAGTTSIGAVDPIAPMIDLCAQTGAWLHIDGAYGYAYKLVPEWSHLFAGDDQADSITWDPHKQLGVPIPNSLLFLREMSDFGRMAVFSNYFNRTEDAETNPGRKSAPSTRPMSALPLVTLLRGQGLNRVVENLRGSLVAIRALADYLHEQPDIELSHQPDTGILCFRMTPKCMPSKQLDALQMRLYQQVMESGQRTISMTALGGRIVLRLVVASPHTKFEDLKETIDVLRDLIKN